jgi:bifunctional non-homologous end joining protein LigD
VNLFIDCLKKMRANRSEAAYTTRARARAPVSVPITWDELSPGLASDHFTVANVAARLRRKARDPWQGYGRARQRLTATILEAVAAV